MIITKATYGGVDVKGIVESKIKGDALSLRVSNAVFGDTLIGVVKYLEIEGKVGETTFSERVKENGIFVYPKTETKRLGIFYSNNNKPETQATIKKSLESIQIASEGVADIITCMWRPQEGNPFRELICWTQTYSHLNQLLQILQCLYAAKEVKDYDFVSFLEHDVLYSAGHFEYPEFKHGYVLTNMNYMGMNRSGFQERTQDDEPFHQMTMRFDDALEHCESILQNAILMNSGLIEPQNLRRKQWKSIHPNVHVNHGHHFTSHNSIYSKETYNPAQYWGNHNDYLYLFP